jgi:hypothetical protein
VEFLKRTPGISCNYTTSTRLFNTLITESILRNSLSFPLVKFMQKRVFFRKKLLNIMSHVLFKGTVTGKKCMGLCERGGKVGRLGSSY